MARGTIAKEEVTQKILNAFPGSFIADKKIYVYGTENGERVQISIALTCPKTEVQVTGTVLAPTATSAFGEGAVTMTVTTAPQVTEMTEEERNNINEMVKRLGL